MIQAELCLRCTFVKASFMFVTNFLDIYENHRRKNFINHSHSIHPEGFYLFEASKRSVKMKKLFDFSPLFRIGTTRVQTVFLSNSRLKHFHLLNNRDT